MRFFRFAKFESSSFGRIFCRINMFFRLKAKVSCSRQIEPEMFYFFRKKNQWPIFGGMTGELRGFGRDSCFGGVGGRKISESLKV